VNELKDGIANYSIKANTGRHVYLGYIGDPLADTARLNVVKDQTFKAKTGTTENIVALNIVALDPGWTNSRIQQALTDANAIYAQCQLQLTADSLLRIETAGYLSNQSPGHALQLHRTLQTTLQPDIPTVYLATDTNMQTKFDAEAFGLANTANRPWMKNSVWITVTTKDTTALANTLLTQEQCQLAVDTAVSNGLIQQ